MSTKGLFFTFAIVVLLFLGTLATIIYFDVGGVQIYARRIAFIDKLLPVDVDTKNIEEEISDYSHSRLIKYTLNLYKQNELNREELDKVKEELKKYNDMIYSENGEMARLKEYETEYTNVKKLKEELEEILVKNNPEEFKKYFAQIYPELAKSLYQKVLEKEQRDADFKKYLGNFTDMNPTQAANVLSQLVRTDYELVVDIVKRLDTEVATKILEKMEVSYVSMITKSITGSEW